MPALNIQGLDDALQWDACPDFSGGQFSNQRANLLKPNQAAYLLNMDTDISGKLTTRRGILQIGDELGEQIQGIAFYNTPDSEELIVAAGGILRAYNGTTWALAGGGFPQLVSALTPAVFVQGVDILYIAQEDSTLRRYSSGAVVPYTSDSVSEVTDVINGRSVTPSVTAEALAATYFLIHDEDGSVCVWFNLDDAAIDPSGGDRSIVVPIVTGYTVLQTMTALAAAVDADSKFTAAELGGTFVRITCVEPGARTDAADVDTGLIVEVVTEGNDENGQPPSGLSLLVWHTDRLIGSGVSTDPDTVYFSQFLDGSQWDRANWSIRIGSGDGEPVTGMLPWTNYNLLVLKHHSIWVVGCDPTQLVSEFQINRVHDRIGSLSPKTVCQVGTDIFFLTDTAEVRSIKNIIASEQQKEVGPPLSYPVQDVLDSVNHAAIATACAFHWNNRYILAVPVDGATVPNLVLVFNTLTESWAGVWSQWYPLEFSSRLDAGIPKLWMGNSDGTVADWADFVPLSQETDLAFKDMGAEIPSQIITRALSWNEPVCPKTGFSVELEFSR